MVNEIVVSREQGNLSKLDNIFKPESVIRSSWIGASDYRPDKNEWTQNNIKGIFSFLTLRCCNFAPVSRRMTRRTKSGNLFITKELSITAKQGQTPHKRQE